MAERTRIQSFSMGRDLRGSRSSSSLESDEFFYFTRPKEISSKSGTSGTPIKLAANYFEVDELPDFQFSQYRVDFEPELDAIRTRVGFIRQQGSVFGGKFQRLYNI